MAVARSSAAGFPAVKVVYYRRMKANRVYPVTVAWGDKPRPTATIKHITLRLLGAGGQIVPSEQALDTQRPDLKATFFVTPLATGWLRAQRLEILVGGRKVQEVPLASKVVCRCWAGFWFICAFVIPPLLIWWRSCDPNWGTEMIREHVPDLPAMIADNVPVLKDAWNKLCEWKGDMYAKACQFNKDRLLAFPMFVTFLLLSLWALFINRDRRTSRWSNPIAIPTGVGEE